MLHGVCGHRGVARAYTRGRRDNIEYTLESGAFGATRNIKSTYKNSISIQDKQNIPFTHRNGQWKHIGDCGSGVNSNQVVVEMRQTVMNTV